MSTTTPASSDSDIKDLYIVGAGFSTYAGKPLQSDFTQALLDTNEEQQPRATKLVDYLRRLVHDAFDHSISAQSQFWPDLEDLFTCVDLSANTGHHLGSTFSPADLRTARRALIARILHMLNTRT